MKNENSTNLVAKNILEENWCVFEGCRTKVNRIEYVIKNSFGELEKSYVNSKTIYRDIPLTEITIPTSYQQWCNAVYEVAEGCAEALSKVSAVKSYLAQACVLVSSILTTPTVYAYASDIGAAGITSGLKEVFDVLMNIALSIGEPILWFYALTALIMMATGKNKSMGISRLKTVLYSYVLVRMLPTLFLFLGWITDTIQVSLQKAMTSGQSLLP